MFQRARRTAVFLADIEIFAVSLVVALSFISARLLPFALGTIGLFWLIRWLACGSLSVRTPADWPVGLLVFMALVTLWATALPQLTVPQVLRLGTGIGMFYTIINWTTTLQRTRWLVLAILLAGLVLALIAPFSVQWSAGKLPFIPASLYSRFTLLVSDTVHPNVLAGNIIILLPIPLGLLLFDWARLRWPYRLIAALAFLAMVAVLILTLSRGSWVALAVVTLGMGMLRWRRGWALALLAAVLLGLWVQAAGAARIAGILASSNTLGTVEGRVEVWSRAIYMIQDFPFTGIGMGLFGELADVLYPFFSFPVKSLSHAHNLFLQVAVDLGIAGLIAWLAVFILASVSAWLAYRQGAARREHWLAGLGAGLVCSQAALVVHGMTDAVTWGMVRPAPLTWVLWGMAFSLWRVRSA
jgi:putative inorganic carbon (HCO3(-)) transporter